MAFQYAYFNVQWGGTRLGIKALINSQKKVIYSEAEYEKVMISVFFLPHRIKLILNLHRKFD